MSDFDLFIIYYFAILAIYPLILLSGLPSKAEKAKEDILSSVYPIWVEHMMREVRK